MSAFPSPPPSLAPPSARKRSLPFSLRIQTSAASPPPFSLGGISSPAVAIPAQGITTALSFDAPPPSAIEPSFSAFPPPSIPALAPLPLPPHLRNHCTTQPSPSSSSVPSLAGSPSSTPSTAMSSSSSSSIPSLDSSRPPRSGGLGGRNPKNLSISTKPSWPTLQVNPAMAQVAAAERKRSNSVSLVLPYYQNSYPEEEEHDPPYPNGPIEILPRVWLGHEGHARDVRLLRERGIGWVLNVAKEVDLELGEEWNVLSTEEALHGPDGDAMDVDEQGQKKIQYLKLPWSHGQQDLCEVGFQSAMRFVDRALANGESVLVHCQCGVSRSATLVMALVIRAGHLARTCGEDPEHPMCRIASHNDAYEYVQGKSRWVGPNIVLINQLVEYSKNLRSGPSAPAVASTSQSQDASRSRTISESTDLSQTVPDPIFSSSSSSASSSPGLASPPTPDVGSPELGPESIEAMLLDKQMEAQYTKLCQQRAAAAAHLAQQQARQQQPRGLGLPVSGHSPLTPPSATSTASPLSASAGSGRSRTRAASAESALSNKAPWNIGMLLRVEEES